MNIHEYQAKQLFLKYDIPILPGIMVQNVDAAIAASRALHTTSWVIKAQVHAGGRGKGGGVQVVNSESAVVETATRLLGSSLITKQTGSHGLPISALLVEETCDIDRELYLSLLVDRGAQQVVFVASTEGGVEIETVAVDFPEKILKQGIDPLLGVLPYQCRALAMQLQLVSTAVNQLTHLMMRLYHLFVACDLSLIEINPLVLTKQGQLICLDAKINVDDNALYRQPLLHAMRDSSQENVLEVHARECELNYIALEGNIGCMVNGAGLAMATMDIIKLQGGAPANFLDVGGGASAQRVKEAFKIILSDHQVKAILVNIFGGIVRCDLIAEGIIKAVSEVGIAVPVVVRLEGNRAAEAAELLVQSGLNIISANTLEEAAKKVVQAAEGVKA